ncbi:MAG: aldehyde dehydrogenase family protein, partial [Flavonifractor sp.]|nr:aldehyde dehydrogenase family protein [Flavonifractor sp.]
MNIQETLTAQRRFFQSGATLPVSFRIGMLKRLRSALDRYEEAICTALTADLGKSSYEGFMCEVGLVRSEISYLIRHTGSFAREHRVPTPLAQFASRSYRKPSPYGNTLIMSPWNYP